MFRPRLRGRFHDSILRPPCIGVGTAGDRPNPPSVPPFVKGGSLGGGPRAAVTCILFTASDLRLHFPGPFRDARPVASSPGRGSPGRGPPDPCRRPGRVSLCSAAGPPGPTLRQTGDSGGKSAALRSKPGRNYPTAPAKRPKTGDFGSRSAACPRRVVWQTGGPGAGRGPGRRAPLWVARSSSPLSPGCQQEDRWRAEGQGDGSRRDKGCTCGAPAEAADEKEPRGAETPRGSSPG